MLVLRLRRTEDIVLKKEGKEVARLTHNGHIQQPSIGIFAPGLEIIREQKQIFSAAGQPGKG